MPYTTPSTWVAGAVLTAAQLNQQLRDNVSFLANPPACRVYNSAAISAGNAGVTTLTFNSERYDTDTMHSTGSNTERITFNTAGLYVVGFTFELAAAADYTVVHGSIRLAGTTVIGAVNGGKVDDNTVAPQATVITVYKFAAAEYVTAVVVQENTAAAARNVTASPNFSPEFWAVRVGIG